MQLWHSNKEIAAMPIAAGVGAVIANLLIGSRRRSCYRIKEMP